MANGKKSFILYADQRHTFKELSDKEAGQLIKHIMDYVNDDNPVLESKLLKIAFEPIRLQLKRDLVDWEEKRKERSESGKKGMEKRWGTTRNITKDNIAINPITKITVNDTVNVNDNVNVNVNKEEWQKNKKQLLNSEQWHYQICTEKQITQSYFLKTLNEFLADQELKEDYKNLRETKNHFINWFNKNHKNAGNKTRSEKQESAISKLIRIGEADYARATGEKNTGS